MSNDLTGDYDVVAEFSILAANRVLAAMHRGNRFPHSLSVYVNDTPQARQTAVSVVDLAGSAIPDRVMVARVVTQAAASPVSAPDPVVQALNQTLDPIVNSVFGQRGLPVLQSFSYLNGVAELQMGAPTMTVPGDSSANATLHVPVMVRYFPNPDTMVLPQFLQGEIQFTLAVKEVSSKAGTFINVNLAGTAGNIAFIQSWPPQHLTGAALTSVNMVLRNSLLTSFQPSNSPLPAGVVNLALKTFPGGTSAAIALMMSMSQGVSPNPNSMSNLFLAEGDQFALAVSGDYIDNLFANAVSSFLPWSANLTFAESVPINVWPFHFSFGFNIDVAITVDTPTIQLVNEQLAFPPITVQGIMLTAAVHIRSSIDSGILSTLSSWGIIPSPPNLDFTVNQLFTLALAQNQVTLVPSGNLGFENLTGQYAQQIQENVQNVFNQLWSSASGQIQNQLASGLSIGNLQSFLESLMNPPVPQASGSSPQVVVDPTLSYTSIEIQSAGVILHGTLTVPDWPAGDVEFALNQWTASSPTPEYDALNSWLPGGTIQEYTWSYGGNVMPPDPNTFVSSDAPAITVLPKPICLTFQGTRISSSGPVVNQSVTVAQLCKTTSTPLVSEIAPGLEAGVASRGIPDVALTSVSATGKVEVVGNTSPWARAGVTPAATANFLIHFPDGKTVAHLDFLTRGLVESQRTDTATAIVCVLGPDQIEKVRSKSGLIFADDIKGWERLLKVKRRPATFVLSPSGSVVWHRQGALKAADLAAALQEHLAAGGFFRPQFLELSLRVGQRASNFLFEYAPARELTLRKLAGRQVVMVFWKSTSMPSLETLANVQKALSPLGAQGPVVLAINVGEDPKLAKRMAAANGFSAIVVPDPDRAITLAYGVNIWPTTIFLDASGIVQNIVYGQLPSAAKPVRTRRKR